MQVRVLKSAVDLEPYLGAWDNLAKDVSEPNVFYESWMFLPALSELKPEADLKLVLVGEETNGQFKLHAFFPLLLRKRYKRIPLHYFSLWQYIHCYLCTPLVRRGLESQALAAFFDWLNTETKLILYNEINRSGSICEALVGLAHNRSYQFHIESFERALFAKGPTSADAYLANKHSRNFKKEMRRKANRLAEHGQVEYKIISTSAEVENWISDFLKLEQQGWKGRQGSALGSASSSKKFFEQVIREGMQRQQVLLAELRLNGELLASGCKLLSGNGGFAFKIAYDEEWSRYSPGLILELEEIERVYKLSQTEWLDSCAAPGTEMANRLWADRREIASLALALRPFPEGLLVKLLAPLVYKLKLFKQRNFASTKLKQVS